MRATQPSSSRPTPRGCSASATEHDDGSVRRGSGEIQIARVEMFAGDSDDARQALPHRRRRPTSASLPSQQDRAQAGDRVHDRTPRRRDGDGAVHARRRPDRRIDLGRGDDRVHLDASSLLPGTYDLHTSVTDFNRQHIYDQLHLAFRFDVMSGKPYETGGVVTMRPTWMFDR